MIDLEAIKKGMEELEKLTEIVKAPDIKFLKWIIGLGEAHAISNRIVNKWNLIDETLKQIEHDIPQFHKQPGSFNKIKESLDVIKNELWKVNNALDFKYNMSEDKDEDDYLDECERDLND